MRHHIIYCTRNNYNLKFYVGKHSCNKLDCDYMGSGKRLTYAICKYGIDNFTRENLAVFGTEAEAYAEEERIVTQEFVDRDDTYNLKCGGLGNPKGIGAPMRSELYDPAILLLIDRMVAARKGWVYITNILNEIGVKAKNGSDMRPSTVLQTYDRMIKKGMVCNDPQNLSLN